MRLSQLIADLPNGRATGDTGVDITGITSDSRAVRPGHLFVALRGQQFDGHAFIAAAVQQGAAAVVCETAPDPPLAVPVVMTDNAHEALGRLACAFHRHPSRRLKLIGVTGTDGKTTTTTLTAAILRRAGARTAHLTTVEACDGLATRPNEAGFTTPQAMDIQAFLAQAVAQGCVYAVLEVSSHALATGRVTGCEFDVAVFTNLAPEHLDYHRTMAEYRAEKEKLFRMLSGPRTKGGVPTGVVNIDDPEAPRFLSLSPLVLTFGFSPQAQVRAEQVRYTAKGTNFFLHLPTNEVTIATRLLGRFNVENWMAAAAAALAVGGSPRLVVDAAATTAAPPGRMERLATDAPFEVFVDFAHTPHGLAAALETLRSITTGRVIAVFGHAGRRDTNHRRDLVAAAKGRCDSMIFTMDDPYDEDPAAILSQMRHAAMAMGLTEFRDFRCIIDRRDAFAAAFAQAKPGDAVLLAGRGHETHIPLNGERLPFHDATVALEVLGG